MALAAACDLRIGSENALFRAAFLTAGISGDYGLSWTLPRIVGPARARELLLLNTKVRAARACEIGLLAEVTTADGLIPRALQLAAALAVRVHKEPPAVDSLSNSCCSFISKTGGAAAGAGAHQGQPAGLRPQLPAGAAGP